MNVKSQKGFGLFELTAVLIVVACVGALGYAFYAKSQNDKQTDSNNVATTKLDYSAGRTLKSGEEDISIDFSKCTSDMQRFDVAMGSTTVEIKGKKGKNCVMNYGGEVENPNWDGKLDYGCKVPADVGLQQFQKTNTGVDLSPIEKYCSKR